MLKTLIVANTIWLIPCLMVNWVRHSDTSNVFIVGVECSRFKFYGLASKTLPVNIGSSVAVLLSSMVNRLRETVLRTLGWS